MLKTTFDLWLHLVKENSEIFIKSTKIIQNVTQEFSYNVLISSLKIQKECIEAWQEKIESTAHSTQALALKILDASHDFSLNAAKKNKDIQNDNKSVISNETLNQVFEHHAEIVKSLDDIKLDPTEQLSASPEVIAANESLKGIHDKVTAEAQRHSRSSRAVKHGEVR